MEQREFARADYKQLDFVGKKRLKEYRDGLAKELNLKRNTINSMLEGELDGLKGIEGLQGEYERAKKHAENTAKIRRAWNILDTRDNARRRKQDEEFKSIGREFKVEKSIKKHEELAEKLRAKKALGKSIKKAGKVAAGTALAAGLVYGGKKLYNKYKNKDMKEQREFTRADYKGLNFIEKFGKKLKRNKIAKELNKRRNQINYERDIDFIHLGDKGAEDLANFKRRSALNRAKFVESTKLKNLNPSGPAAEVLKGDLKKAGLIGAGVAGTAALAYGAKKLYDKNKGVKEQKEFARTVYETEPKNVPMEIPKVSKEKASKLRDMFNRTKESIKNSKVGKNAADFYAKHEKGVKIGGGVAAGTALAAGLAVGAKKLADKKKEQQKEFARADYAGLNGSEQAQLKKLRDKAAKQLRSQRNRVNANLADNLKTMTKEEALNRANKSRNVLLNDSFFNKAYLRDKAKLSNTVKKFKNRETALGVAGATALTAGLAYGGKKLYDKYKKNNESDNKD